MKNLTELGIRVPDILLPARMDTGTWAVIACDQYTQDNAYWENARSTAADKPSTLNLILPEIYLGKNDTDQRIQHIKQTMRSYLDSGVFAPAVNAFIYIERTTAYGRTRHGLLAAIDLETYEWKPFSTALIRATEATIVERIPPRKAIRTGAPLELPHIMLLADDPDHALVEHTGELVKRSGAQPVYEGPLMLNGGSIKGWKVQSLQAVQHIQEALNAIADRHTAPDGSVFLFATGDGNHSLATAKAVWDEYKAAAHVSDGPARYALVEIVNIYDTGLTFEPIHRVVFNADPDALVSRIQKACAGRQVRMESAQALADAVHKSAASFGFSYTAGGIPQYIKLDTDIKELAVSRLQPELDAFIAEHNARAAGQPISVDYIHGDMETLRLGEREHTTAILLPPIAKDSFFSTISSTGPLPRKSFSMGHADEKRFYLECRRLFS